MTRQDALFEPPSEWLHLSNVNNGDEGEAKKGGLIFEDLNRGFMLHNPHDKKEPTTRKEQEANLNEALVTTESSVGKTELRKNKLMKKASNFHIIASDSSSSESLHIPVASKQSRTPSLDSEGQEKIFSKNNLNSPTSLSPPNEILGFSGEHFLKDSERLLVPTRLTFSDVHKNSDSILGDNNQGVTTEVGLLKNTNTDVVEQSTYAEMTGKKELDAILLPKLKAMDEFKKALQKTKDSTVFLDYSKYMWETGLELGKHESEANEIELLTLKKQFLKESVHYLKKLSVKGYSAAQYLLGKAYSSGELGKPNYKEAFVLFQTAAKHGHVEAAFETASCYEKGIGTLRDSRKAVEFLKYSATRHHTMSMLKLGTYSFYGKMGLSNDLNTKQNGIKWLTRAVACSDKSTCSAPYELAKIYEKGFLDIIIPDEKYAMNLFIQASALGHSKSNTKLGQIYEKGNSCVQPNSALSIHYYTLAATDTLHPDAQAQLSLCAWYLAGAEDVLESDQQQAFLWALKSAKGDHPKAQYAVGKFYEKGIGCTINFNEAFIWYEKAAKNNDSKAISKVQKMTGHVTNDIPANAPKKDQKNTLNSSNSQSSTLLTSLISNLDDSFGDSFFQKKNDRKTDDNIEKTKFNLDNVASPIPSVTANSSKTGNPTAKNTTFLQRDLETKSGKSLLKAEQSKEHSKAKCLVM
ncbi:hypothetical protein ACO0QE_004255 [Hanseniaspora vineae]